MSKSRHLYGNQSDLQFDQYCFLEKWRQNSKNFTERFTYLTKIPIGYEIMREIELGIQVGMLSEKAVFSLKYLI